jgi:regulatory protein
VRAAGQITALEPQQKREGRVNVYVDGKFAIGLFEEVVLALGLHLGQTITPGRLTEISAAETLRRAKEDAYRLLSFRARSEKEIQDRLGRKGYEPPVVDEVLASLRGYGYVNDAAFAETWVSERGKTRGRRALAHELRQKGITGDIAADVLNEAKTDEAELAAARTVAVKRVGERPSDASREAQAKLAAFLQRRGFGWNIIRPVLADLYGRFESEEDEEQENDD